MEISDRVGEVSSDHEEEITPELVRQFAEAVGSAETELAPPTFLTRWRHGEFELFEKLGIPMARILHGEQDYRYHAPIAPGMRVTCRTRLKDAIVKKGRKTSLNFLTFETEVFSRSPGPRVADPVDDESRGRRVATSLTTIVVRGDLDGAVKEEA